MELGSKNADIENKKSLENGQIGDVNEYRSDDSIGHVCQRWCL